METPVTRPRTVALLASIALATATGGTVHAQAPDPDAITRARALNQKGENLFAIAEYDRAIAAFKEAYELAPTPGLLFNIAQAYRLQGPASCKDAVRFYRNYLLALPDGPNRDQVDKHLAELEPCPALTPVAPAPDAAPVPPPVRVEPRPSRWPHAIAISGGAIAVIGGALFFVADRRYRELRDGECAARDCDESVWAGDRRIERVGVGAMIGGAAIAITGVVWLATRRTADDDPRTALTPWADASSAGVSFGGRW